MTVITKPLNDKKSDNLEDPLVENIVTEYSQDDGRKPDGGENGGYRPEIPRGRIHYIAVVRSRPYYAFALILMVILFIATCLLGIFGTEYLYQRYWYAMEEEQDLPGIYRAEGTIAYVSDEQQAEASVLEGKDMLEESAFLSRLLSELALLNQANEGQIQEMQPKREEMKAEFELDLEKGQYEKINLPSQSTGRFVHDFYVNMSAIVDTVNGRCFIMPLDRSKIQPPDGLYNLVFNLANGYYTLDTAKIRQEMHVVLPAVPDPTVFGSYIGAECKTYDTYKLEDNPNHDGIVKRSVTNSKTFTTFTGDHVMEVKVNGPEDVVY